jgi:type VI secretion system protein ImpK
MTPDFATAVDPVFLNVLRILARIRDGNPPTPDEARSHARNLIAEAEARVGQRRDWELAKYALVAWIDEMLIDSPWDGQSWWKENSLEVEMFRTRERATQFFANAKEAATLTRRDALEVYYVCVMLAFRGLYRGEDAAFLADQLELPPTLAAWVQQVSRSIELAHSRPTINYAPQPGKGAPPLDGKFSMVGAALMTLVLSATAGMLTWLLLFVF